MNPSKLNFSKPLNRLWCVFFCWCRVFAGCESSLYLWAGTVREQLARVTFKWTLYMRVVEEKKFNRQLYRFDRNQTKLFLFGELLFLFGLHVNHHHIPKANHDRARSVNEVGWLRFCAKQIYQLVLDIIYVCAMCQLFNKNGLIFHCFCQTEFFLLFPMHSISNSQLLN